MAIDTMMVSSVRGTGLCAEEVKPLVPDLTAVLAMLDRNRDATTATATTAASKGRSLTVFIQMQKTAIIILDLHLA